MARREGLSPDTERLLQMAVLQVRRGAKDRDVVDRIVAKGGMDPDEAAAAVADIRGQVRADYRASGIRNVVIGAGILLLGVGLTIASVFAPGRYAILWWGAIVLGFGQAFRGAEQLWRASRLRG